MRSNSKSSTLISYRERLYSIVMVILGFSCSYFRKLVTLGQFPETGSQCHISLEFAFLTLLTHKALKLLCSVNYFVQVGHEVFKNQF